MRAFYLLAFVLFSNPSFAQWMMPARQVLGDFNNNVPGQTTSVSDDLQTLLDDYLLPGKDIADMLYDPNTKTWYGLDETYLIGTNILDMLYDETTKSWYGLDLTYMVGTNISDMLFDEGTMTWYGLDLTYMVATNIVGADYVADSGGSQTSGQWYLPLYRPVIGRVLNIVPNNTALTPISGYVEEFGGPVGLDPELADYFNEASGVFTAGQSGIYQVTFSAYPVLTGALVSENDYANFYINRGGTTEAILSFYQYHADDTTNTFIGTWTETDSYDQGETISFSVQYPNNFGDPRKFTAVANFHFLGPWTDAQ